MVGIFIFCRFEFLFTIWLFFLKSKHQLDRQAVSAVVALDERNLLTASSLIKWWHWPNKQLLKTFNGHSSEVQTLWPIMFEDCTRVPKLPTHNKVNGGLNGNGTVLMNGDEKMHIDDEEEEPQDENKLSSFYFLSAAKSDRYICAWWVNLVSWTCRHRLMLIPFLRDLGAENSNSIANFSMDEDPRSIQLAYTSSTQVRCYWLHRVWFFSKFVFLYCRHATSWPSPGRARCSSLSIYLVKSTASSAR